MNLLWDAGIEVVVLAADASRRVTSHRGRDRGRAGAPAGGPRRRRGDAPRRPPAGSAPLVGGDHRGRRHRLGRAATSSSVALNDWDWDAAAALGRHRLALACSSRCWPPSASTSLARPGTLARGDGRGPARAAPAPFRDLRRRLEPYARYREIIGIARRNGLACPGHRRRHRPVAARAARRGAAQDARGVRRRLREARPDGLDPRRPAARRSCAPS